MAPVVALRPRGEPQEPSPSSHRRTTALDLGGLAVLSLFLSFWGITDKSVWLDEAISVSHARGSFRSLLHVISKSDPNMGLYYFLLHFWVRLFGEGEAAIRSLSALFAVGAVLVTYLLGRRLFGRLAGLLAGLLLATNALFIHYAQEARAYSLVVLLCASACYFLVAELERPASWSRIGYALSISLAIYAHYFAFYVLLAQLLTVVVLRGRKAFARDWLAVWLFVAALCEPEVWFASQVGSGGISWIARPKPIQIKHVAVDLAGGRLTLLAFALVLSSYGLYRTWSTRERWRYGLVVAWFLVPLLVSYLASYKQPMFIVYYLLEVTPALALLTAVGLARIPWRPLLGLLLAVVLWQTGLELQSWYANPRPEDWSGASSYVFSHERKSDAVVFFPDYGSTPFYYYKAVAGNKAPAPLPWLTPDVALKQPAPVRIWVLARTQDQAFYGAKKKAFTAAILVSRTLSEQHLFGNVEVQLYSEAPPP